MGDTKRAVLLIGYDKAASTREIMAMLDGMFTVMQADTVDDAVLRFDKQQISALIVDMEAAGNEQEIFQIIEKGFKSIPVVVLSDESNEDRRTSALKSGACDYLVKGRLNSDLLHRSLLYAADRSLLDKALSQSRRRYRQLLNSVTDYVYTVQVEHGKAVGTTHGPGCVALTGYTCDEYAADPHLWYRMVHEDDRQSVMQQAADVLSGKAVEPIEHRIVHKDGRLRWIKNTAVPNCDESGRLVSYDGLASDITDRKLAEHKLRHAASYDSLTHLPNRELFRDRLRQALIQAHRHNTLLSVMFLDLDRFQGINDMLGHTRGDQVLKDVADRLADCIRKGDTIARVGGDEFIVLCTDMADARNAATLAKKIQNSLSEIFMVDGHEFFITASIGISIFPQDGDDSDTLIKNADAAMYQARSQGSNSCQFYSSAMNAETLKKLILETDLRKALDREEFVLYYQPLIELSSGRITGAEALVRWQHPRYGLLQPNEFISVAEETGLIIPIGDWTLRTVCSQAREWQRDDFSNRLRLSVNLSMRQFRNNALMETVFHALEASDLDPRNLELELTESTIMQNAEQTIATLHRFKSTGIQIALDDFGTGYSSLSYLINLPLNKLKLDRSFISALSKDKSNEAISKAIITLAHNLDLKVVAEGVETIEQLELLRLLKCDEVQGYLFCRPVPHEEITRLLREDAIGTADFCAA